MKLLLSYRLVLLRSLIGGLSMLFLANFSVEAAPHQGKLEKINYDWIEQSFPGIKLTEQNFCQAEEKTFVVAETRSLWVYICGNQQPNSSVLVRKSNGKSVRLGLESYQGSQYIATTPANTPYAGGNYVYTLNRESLTISYHNRQVFQQQVTQWKE